MVPRQQQQQRRRQKQKQQHQKFLWIFYKVTFLLVLVLLLQELQQDVMDLHDHDAVGHRHAQLHQQAQQYAMGGMFVQAFPPITVRDPTKGRRIIIKPSTSHSGRQQAHPAPPPRHVVFGESTLRMYDNDKN